MRDMTEREFLAALWRHGIVGPDAMGYFRRGKCSVPGWGWCQTRKQTLSLIIRRLDDLEARTTKRTIKAFTMHF